MGIRVMKKGNGYRRWWYGEFREGGKLHRVKLTVKVAGEPPASLSARDEGNHAYEISKVKAQKAFDDFMQSRQQKGNAETLMESLIESKTGEKVAYVRLDELAVLWNGLARTRELSEERQQNNAYILNGFAKFCKCEFLYQVTADHVRDYFNAIRKDLAWDTVKSRMCLLSGAFNRFLPHGCLNPFKTILKRDTSEDAATIHRVPLTDAQIAKVKECARNDELLYPLLICGLNTGARLKDICLMRKDSIDLRDGFVSFIAAKTNTRCEIPLFDEFRNLCEGIITSSDPKEPLLFPDAATMYIHNRSGIIRRGKILFAKALFADILKDAEPTLIENGEPIPPKTADEVLALIDRQHYTAQKTERMKMVYQLYAVEKKSYRVIEAETKLSRGSIYGYMMEIETMTKDRIVRFEQGKSRTRQLLAHTRIIRKSTNRAVSTYGWASLRATFCRLAIENGVDTKQIMKAVGHKQFTTTMTYYNNPTREHQKQLWLKASARKSSTSSKGSAELQNALRLIQKLSPSQLQDLTLGLQLMTAPQATAIVA